MLLETHGLEDWESRRLEATVQAAALCAYVDDHLAPEEREMLCECIATHAPSESEARRLIAFAKGLPEWIEAPPSGYRAAQLAEIRAGLRTQEERRYAYYLAAQVAAAHMGVSMAETSLLLNIMSELDIDRAYARGVLQEVKRAARSRGGSS